MSIFPRTGLHIVSIHPESVSRETGRNFPSSNAKMPRSPHRSEKPTIQARSLIQLQARKPYRLFRVSSVPAHFVKYTSFRMNTSQQDNTTPDHGMKGYKVAISKRPHIINNDREMPQFDSHALINALKTFTHLLFLYSTKAAKVKITARYKGFFDLTHKPLTSKQPLFLLTIRA